MIDEGVCKFLHMPCPRNFHFQVNPPQPGIRYPSGGPEKRR